MKNLTKFLNPILTDNFSDNATYEVIEHEVIEGKVIKGLEISGSLFSLTTFKNCIFESCVFFGSKIENCDFLGSTFQNCKFQFSSIENTNLVASVFKNCTWELSPIKNCKFDHTFLDTKTAYYAHKSENIIISCSSERALDWDQALMQELPLEASMDLKTSLRESSKLEETIAFFRDWKTVAS